MSRVATEYEYYENAVALAKAALEFCQNVEYYWEPRVDEFALVAVVERDRRLAISIEQQDEGGYVLEAIPLWEHNPNRTTFAESEFVDNVEALNTYDGLDAMESYLAEEKGGYAKEAPADAPAAGAVTPTGSGGGGAGTGATFAVSTVATVLGIVIFLAVVGLLAWQLS